LHTYLLSDDAVRRYGIDFVSRLESLGAQIPKLWITLGISGDKIAEAITRDSPQSPALPQELIRVSFDRASKNIIVRDGDHLPKFADKPILVIDAAIHSGSSMRHIVDSLFQNGIKDVLTYSLVVKKTSEFVPNYFGMIIEEHDRVFFQLDKYPNNRLRKALPFGSLRTLRADDISRVPNSLSVGVQSIDRMCFADLWYYVRTQNSNVYVYELAGKIVAYLHFKYQSYGKLFLDLIACDLTVQGLHIGSLLMRWAETFARSSKCLAIELWAIENRISWYADHGYEAIPGEILDLGPGEKYQKMSRRILYNIKPIELTIDAI
jgi:GNAT superfamily N-acetyltransferase